MADSRFEGRDSISNTEAIWNLKEDLKIASEVEDLMIGELARMGAI